MQRQKRNGGAKKIGYFCDYVPEELIIAAGLSPVRANGRVASIKEADAYFFSNVCPYVKNILDSGLRNKFDDLDGIIFANSCDGMRRLYDLWQKYVETPFVYMLEIPKNKTPAAMTYFSKQLFDLKEKLESAFFADISEERLAGAISVMNERRKLMMDLFEGQKETPPRYSGCELLSISRDEALLPKNAMENEIKNLLTRPQTEDGAKRKQPRILVMGNIMDHPILFEMIENDGAGVVVFDTCNGLKHYELPVENSSTPMESLARRYLLKPSCARMPGFEERIERLKRLIAEFDIDGVIFNHMKFCDYSLFETPGIKDFLDRRKLPFLIIENDYLWGDTERIKTRIEAFLEMVDQDESMPSVA